MTPESPTPNEPANDAALDRQVRVFLESRPLIQAHIAALVRDASLAEDVFQEVWIRFERATRKGEVITHVPAWSRAAARLVALEMWRERRREQPLPDEELAALVDRAYEAQDDREQYWRGHLEALGRCLESLPIRSRELLTLRYRQGISVNAIASELGQSVGSVKTTLCRLRLALAECVRGKWPCKNPPDMNARRLEELLIAWEDNNLTDEERAELKHLLATQPEARRRLVEAGVLQSAAQARVRAWEEAPTPHLLPASDAQRKVTWFSWRPFTAAAAGLALGFFCASMAWAYVAPRGPMINERTVSPVNGDFEGAVLPVSEGMPRQFGVWSGDFARITESEQGVQPKSGTHMLRMLRSDSRTSVPRKSGPGDLMQLIDLRPFAADLASGNAVLEFSASGNTSAPHGDQFRFGIQVFALAGAPADLGAEMRDVMLAALASSRKGSLLDGDPSTWETGTTRVLLPPEASFVMVRVVVTQKDAHTQGPVEFEGLYIDDVQLVLKTQTTKATRRKDSPKP